MSRRLILSLFCYLLILMESHSFAEVDLTELVKNIHPAVATVITYDKNKKPLGQGSGFFIDANGHLITNYHVLAGAYHAEARTYDGKRYPVKSVIGENKKMDLIKVLVDIPLPSVQWIEATRILPSVAERVVVIGSPMGLEQTVSEGIVSSVREIPEKGEILQISAAISSGSSGSPVVNMKGKVVGIVSFYLIKGQSLNFAVPAQYLLDLKPSKTIKTISEWASEAYPKWIEELVVEERKLFVHTEPKGAKIRILNIKPKFYQGIMLIPGRYHIEVSADGYEMKKVWIEIEPGEDKNLRVSLEKRPQLFSQNTDELLSISDTYVEKGEYEKAISVLNQAIRINPDYADAYAHLGIVYGFLGRYYEAIEACKNALRIQPAHLMALMTLGATYVYLGRYTEAIETQKRAIKINPDHAMAHFGLGTAYLRSGDKRAALDQYRILKDLDKKLANQLFNLIYE